MNLTPELKAEIDAKPIIELLERWRYSPVGDPMLQDESGTYWCQRMRELREQDPGAYVEASKALS